VQGIHLGSASEQLAKLLDPEQLDTWVGVDGCTLETFGPKQPDAGDMATPAAASLEFKHLLLLDQGPAEWEQEEEEPEPEPEPAIELEPEPDPEPLQPGRCLLAPARTCRRWHATEP
jgi:hypothetical protein